MIIKSEDAFVTFYVLLFLGMFLFRTIPPHGYAFILSGLVLWLIFSKWMNTKVRLAELERDRAVARAGAGEN